MVVPVLVALGSLIPLSFKYVFLYEKAYVLIQANGFVFTLEAYSQMQLPDMIREVETSVSVD